MGDAVRRIHEHLSGEEIQHLASLAGDAAADGQEDLMRHLDLCLECRLRMLEIAPKGERPGEMTPSGSDDSPTGCPPDTKWLELAAGLLTSQESTPLLEHASGCMRCGQLLKAATEDLSLELTPEEESKVLALRSAKTEEQAELAVQLSRRARRSIEKPRMSFRRPVPLRAFSSAWIRVAAAVLILTGSWSLWTIFRASSVESLLAQAYTERRVMELRIPGARYAPKRVTRGAADSARDLPQSLQDANATISRQLKAHPDDPKWLQASARADLLEFHYEAAIRTLRRALDIQPDSPALMVDLATAYYQRGEAGSDRAVDYAEAVEYLSRTLAKTPDDPVALFNRAIAEEKLQLYDPAVSDWQHYLRIDPQGDWAEEARRRLSEVQDKASGKQSSLRKPLLTVEGIAARAGTADLAQEIDDRVEDYLHLALRQWLPQALEAQSPDSRQAQTALAQLAEVTKEQHQDWWLADLLHAPCGPSCPPAAAALALAVQANDNGDYTQGAESAHKAVGLFLASGNLAGQFRAQAEEVYANHLLYKGDQCMALVRNLVPQLQLHKYPWLQAHLDLEEANCASLLGDLGAMQTAIRDGINQAERHHYLAIHLRGIGLQAGTEAHLGNTQQCFSLASQGLEAFWSSEVDLMKGYNLYTDLIVAANVLRMPYFQVVVLSQATALIDLHPDVLQRAVAHQWFGNSAYLAGMSGVAKREFAAAASLFALAPQTEATLRGRLDAEIWLAGFEVRQGELKEGAARLQKIQESRGQLSGFGPGIRFYTTQADLGLQLKDFGATESALRSGILLSESALSSLSSEKERSNWANQTDRVYRNLVSWKLLQGDPRAALEFWEWYKGAGFRSPGGEDAEKNGSLGSSVSLDPDNAPELQTPAQVAGMLSSLKEQTVVSYAVLPDGLAAWVVDNRGISYQWIPQAPAELESLAMQFQRLCSAPDSSLTALHSTARALYDILIAPIENRLAPGRTLVFELDGFLSAIPMEALVGHDGRYLGERLTIAYAASLYQTLRLHRATPITPQSPALIVSVPAPGGASFAPLAEAEGEALAVAARFHSARRLHGQDAKLAAVLGNLRGVAVFHFAGHAVALPDMSGLVLAEKNSDGRPRLIDGQSLSPETISNLQLAVLSACDTGSAAGGATGIASTGSLAEILLRSGVPHVVASRWSVDSVETTKLMRQFYQSLMSGNSVATALHAAQQALATQPASAHPYYWAAFRVQGF